MKNVLIVTDFQSAGGAEVVARETIDLLNGEEFKMFHFFGEKRHRIPINPFQYIFSIRYFVVLLFVLIRKRIDIVHIHGFYHILSPSIFQALRIWKLFGVKKKVIYTVHDFYFLSPATGYYRYKNGSYENFNEPPSIKVALFSKVDNRGFFFDMLKKIQWLINVVLFRAYSTIDEFVHVCEFTKSQFLKVPRYKRFNHTVIYNPIFFDKSLKIYSKDSSPIKILCGARLSPEKGVEFLIDSISQINENFILDIYGDGPLKNSINEKLLLVNDKRITIKNPISKNNFLKEMETYDLFILPSLSWETGAMAAVEAISHGLLVITGQGGGTEEMVRKFGHGFFFERNNSNSLINEVKKLVQLKSECKIDAFIEMNNVMFQKNCDVLTKEHYCNKISKVYYAY